ncbi:MAG: response regulator transcription factor [Acidobacteriaceae bacterium]|nr:response regulator transcription factor [Acidobacteriaceae bacterium]
MTDTLRKRTVAICDTQPITAEGLRTLLEDCRDLEFCEMVDTLELATMLVRRQNPDILIIDKALGLHSVLDWLNDLKMLPSMPSVVVWGVTISEAEALRMLQCGARGIVRKTADLEALLTCLRTVAAGRSWMEDSVFRDSVRPERYARSELTAREQQVLELVEQGFKNKEIANELGIRPGTVKIHLKHIFEKTGVRGRYGLAISGLKDKGLVSLASSA